MPNLQLFVECNADGLCQTLSCLHEILMGTFQANLASENHLNISVAKTDMLICKFKNGSFWVNP